jgi:hypothetical protein
MDRDGGAKGGCGRNAARVDGRQRGAVQIEQLVLIATVALPFAAAAAPLGGLLLGYHQGIELVLALPIP